MLNSQIYRYVDMYTYILHMNEYLNRSYVKLNLQTSQKTHFNYIMYVGPKSGIYLKHNLAKHKPYKYLKPFFLEMRKRANTNELKSGIIVPLFTLSFPLPLSPSLFYPFLHHSISLTLCVCVVCQGKLFNAICLYVTHVSVF